MLIILGLAGTTTRAAGIKSHRIRKVENHCLHCCYPPAICRPDDCRITTDCDLCAFDSEEIVTQRRTGEVGDLGATSRVTKVNSIELPCKDRQASKML